MNIQTIVLLAPLSLVCLQCGKADPGTTGAGECNSEFLASYYGVDSTKTRENLVEECQGFFDKFPETICQVKTDGAAGTKMRWQSNEDGSEWTHVPSHDLNNQESGIYLSSADHEKKCKNLIIKR